MYSSQKARKKLEMRYQDLSDQLFLILKPLFEQNGKVDLSTIDPSFEYAHLIGGILDCRLQLEFSETAKGLIADDVKASNVIVKDSVISFWGLVYWLSTPGSYEVNKSGKDPFYAEFKCQPDRLGVITMKCGEFEKTSLNRFVWTESPINWIFEFS